MLLCYFRKVLPISITEYDVEHGCGLKIKGDNFDIVEIGEAGENMRRVDQNYPLRIVLLLELRFPHIKLFDFFLNACDFFKFGFCHDDVLLSIAIEYVLMECYNIGN